MLIKKRDFFIQKKKNAEMSQDDDIAVFFMIQRYSSCSMCMCDIYSKAFKSVCVWHVWHVCVKRSSDVWMWICVCHWVAPYLREHKISHSELGLGPLMAIEYSTFWRICSTGLAFCWAKPIMKMIWFVRLKKKSIIRLILLWKEKSRCSKYSLSGSNCGSMRLRVNECIERTCKKWPSKPQLQE